LNQEIVLKRHERSEDKAERREKAQFTRK